MTSAESWTPPDDPDLAQLAATGFSQWRLDLPKIVAFDTETTGLTYQDTPFGASFAWVSDDVIQGRDVYGCWFDFTLPNAPKAAAMILEAADVIIGHNLKFDMHKADSIGIAPDWSRKELHDTEAMAHLLDEHRRKGLKDLMVSVLGVSDTVTLTKRRKNDAGEMEEYQVEVPREKHEIDEARKWAKKHHGLDSISDVGYHLLPRGTVVPYAITDAVETYRLAAALQPQVAKFADMSELYLREMRLTRVIYEMERAGMGVDLAYLKQEVAAYRTKCLQHELRIEGIVGKEVRTGKIPAKEVPNYFNPASPAQVAEFFTKAEGHRRPSYDAEALGQITHPLASILLEYRADAKILQTYLEALRAETGSDGVFHGSMRQHGTVSGRTSYGAERGDM